jgi:hypothetical protein
LLTNEGIIRNKIPDPNAHLHLQIEFPLGSGRLTDVIFPKERDDLVIIASSTQLSKEHNDKLMAKPEKERDEIPRNMRSDLLFKDSEFQMIPNAANPQQVHLSGPCALKD